MSNYTYEISDNNVIKVWFPGQELTDKPVISQDVHPEGRNWVDKDEAEAWVLEFIANKERETNESVVE